ncbi:ribosome-associated translation inhibitor RaiA [Robertkochia marina]|uniref:Ribosome-associated translation inhibitor RaiA n=1 Tax=Robertkochia marina TaxID=1227945 RepID=A0A4S3M321_9FLAO|nr:ribosome-associated translation inhibitor RaiA [Robertkochia marina]THD67895.1 ribosome-associated translation inhibitor RaiA [Robertkochia marina]TRZ41002.1 ribosome-associated translation inhibitor RaiA [Robertkochia marina]
MQINFEYDAVSASPRLEEMVSNKINKLVDKYDFIVRADVFFKTENTSTPDSGKICNIQLSAPGPRLFAQANTKSYEMSIAEATEDLSIQLRKRKEKMKAHH